MHGYITHHGFFCLHVKYHYTKLGHTTVMNIWNVDAQQRQRYLTWSNHVILCQFQISCYIMSVSNKLSYLLVSIVLLSHDRATIIFTLKVKMNIIAFIIKGSFEGRSNWNMDWITPYDFAIDICIFHYLCFRRHVIFQGILVHILKQNFSIPATTFDWRDIVFRIWCLSCNSHWSKWPKTFCGRCIVYPDSKVHGANMGPTWALSAPGGPHVRPMNLVIRDGTVVTERQRQSINQTLKSRKTWHTSP